MMRIVLRKRCEAAVKAVVGAVLVSAALSGCGMLGGGEAKPAAVETQVPATLDDTLAALVPMPFEIGQTKEGLPNELAEDAAAAAAAAASADVDALRAGADGAPVLRPGLVLQVTVMVGDKKEVDEPRLQVSGSGDVSLPFVNKVAVTGLTLAEFSEKLEQLYAGYMRDPQVTADFVFDAASGDSPWGRVLVLGRVRNPGPVSIPPTGGMTVSKAIQMAGGFDTSAKDSGIIVTRRMPDGNLKQYPVDLPWIGRTGRIDRDLKLEPADVVWVPTRKL